MKTFLLIVLKIVLVAGAMWWLLHNAPLIMAPVAGAVLAVMGFVFTLVVALAVGATVGLSLLIALGVVACVIAAALSPVWLPLLAIAGVVLLCRPRPAKHV